MTDADSAFTQPDPVEVHPGDAALTPEQESQSQEEPVANTDPGAFSPDNPPAAAPPMFPPVQPKQPTTPEQPKHPSVGPSRAHEINGPNGMYIPENSPAHMGESLKEMVLRSMAEAEKREKAQRAEKSDDADNTRRSVDG